MILPLKNQNTMRHKNSLFKIVVIGQSAVGKTSILKLYCDDKLTQNYKATIGVDLMTKQLAIEGKIVALEIWDTAGQERFRSMTDAFYRDSKCCILVFDLTEPDTFKQIESWKQTFLQKGSPNNPETFPLFLVGNKSDLKDRRKVHEDQINSYLSQNKNMMYFQTSILCAQSVQRMMTGVAKVLISREDDMRQINLYETVQITPKNQKNKAKGSKKVCC